MPSSYSTSLRFELQFTGENVNLWGDKLNAALSRADDAVAGWLTKALVGNYTLATANGAGDEARRAMLKFTGTGAFTVTAPAVSKRYDVWNACTGDLTVTNGSTSVVVKAGEVVSIVTDGGANIARVQGADFGGSRVTSVGTPTANSDAVTKAYVDATVASAVYSTGTFGVAIVPGDSGKFLMNNGSSPTWGNPNASPAITGGLTLSGSAKQNVQTVAAASIDLTASDFFTKSISANTTFTFDNATASKAQAFGLKLTIASAAVPTWPATVKWTSGAALTLGNGTHVLGFITFDGGTSWVGILAAFNVS
jgi:hypothetical protein